MSLAQPEKGWSNAWSGWDAALGELASLNRSARGGVLVTFIDPRHRSVSDRYFSTVVRLADDGQPATVWTGGADALELGALWADFVADDLCYSLSPAVPRSWGGVACVHDDEPARKVLHRYNPGGSKEETITRFRINDPSNKALIHVNRHWGDPEPAITGYSIATMDLPGSGFPGTAPPLHRYPGDPPAPPGPRLEHLFFSIEDFGSGWVDGVQAALTCVEAGEEPGGDPDVPFYQCHLERVGTPPYPLDARLLHDRDIFLIGAVGGEWAVYHRVAGDLAVLRFQNGAWVEAGSIPLPTEPFWELEVLW